MPYVVFQDSQFAEHVWCQVPGIAQIEDSIAQLVAQCIQFDLTEKVEHLSHLPLCYPGKAPVQEPGPLSPGHACPDAPEVT